jgi:NADH dehydrogenase
MAAKRMVIIGGGFAGLQLARKLNNHPSYEIMLIDKVSYHQFQPLLYQVATAGLEPSNISFPLRKIFHHSKNVRIRITTVLSIDHLNKTVITDTVPFKYDILVLATGADTNFFGNETIAAHALPMKSTYDALTIMNRLINSFEDALDALDEPERLAKYRNIVIVGGGPTGVELSGALAEMRDKILPKDYPELNFKNLNIHIVDSGEKPLKNMSEKSSRDCQRYLDELKVQTHFDKMVKNYDGETVSLDDGTTIKAHVVIWAAGIKGNLPAGFDKALVVRGNRIKTDAYGHIDGIDGVYAVGDIASMHTEDYPEGHPQLASVARVQANNLAENFKRAAAGKPPRPFVYKDKGTMATIGRRKAVVDLTKPKIHLNGTIAWLVWMFLHLMLIFGGKNRLQVFINWMYKYFTFDQSLRMSSRYLGKPEILTLQS